MNNIDIKCPNCEKINNYKINDKFSTKNIDNIINESAFIYKCNKCKTKIRLDYPFILETDEYIISYNIKNIKSKKNIRFTENFDDLKEKILIFNDDLNDIIIEYIKNDIIKKLCLKDKTLRYDSKNDQYLIFTILEDGKNIGYLINDYELIKKKAKIKNNQIVNKNNFHKYIKL